MDLAQDPGRASDGTSLPSSVEWSSVRRIHVIGGPGSGKSTFSNRVADALRLPVYSLDSIAYEGAEFSDRNLEDCSADVREIAARDTWICEGIFVGWVDELVRKADVVVWLDHLTWPKAARNILKRFVVLAAREIKTQRG